MFFFVSIYYILVFDFDVHSIQIFCFFGAAAVDFVCSCFLIELQVSCCVSLFSRFCEWLWKSGGSSSIQ